MEIKRSWFPAFVKSKNWVKMNTFTIYYTLYYLSSSLAKCLQLILKSAQTTDNY